MNIVIRNYLSGSFLLDRDSKVWDAIVILDSGLTPTDFVAQHSRRHLYIQFDDVLSDDQAKQIPSITDIQSALDFGAQSENLLVCCRAGQSRSAAIAFLICHQQLGSDAARRLLDPKRHVPNRLIVDLGAQLIDDPSVLRTFHDWQAENKHVTLSDYLDDIEREFDELELQGARNRIVTS